MYFLEQAFLKFSQGWERLLFLWYQDWNNIFSEARELLWGVINSSPLLPTTTKQFQTLSLALGRLITLFIPLFKIVSKESMFYRCWGGVVAQGEGKGTLRKGKGVSVGLYFIPYLCNSP